MLICFVCPEVRVVIASRQVIIKKDVRVCGFMIAIYLNRTSFFIVRGNRRLLRHTFLIAMLLVSGGLVTSGAIELFFRYGESVMSIHVLQQEMADGAAFKSPGHVGSVS